jgi:hypothetical protein
MGAVHRCMRRGTMIRTHRDKEVTLLGKDEFINNEWRMGRCAGGCFEIEF